MSYLHDSEMRKDNSHDSARSKTLVNRYTVIKASSRHVFDIVFYTQTTPLHLKTCPLVQF